MLLAVARLALAGNAVAVFALEYLLNILERLAGDLPVMIAFTTEIANRARQLKIEPTFWTDNRMRFEQDSLFRRKRSFIKEQIGLLLKFWAIHNTLRFSV